MGHVNQMGHLSKIPLNLLEIHEINPVDTREILNLNLSCTPNNTSKVKESICMYIKQLYWILEN